MMFSPAAVCIQLAKEKTTKSLPHLVNVFDFDFTSENISRAEILIILENHGSASGHGHLHFFHWGNLNAASSRCR